MTTPMIDLLYVKKLVELLDQSSVDSIEISSEKGMKLRISKTPQQRGGMQVASQVAMPTLIPAPVAAPLPTSSLTSANGVPAVAPEEVPARVEPPKAKQLEVKSPMVGTFYRRRNPRRHRT